MDIYTFIYEKNIIKYFIEEIQYIYDLSHNNFEDDKIRVQKHILDKYNIKIEDNNINNLIYYLSKINNNINLIKDNIDNLRYYIEINDIQHNSIIREKENIKIVKINKKIISSNINQYQNIFCDDLMFYNEFVISLKNILDKLKCQTIILYFEYDIIYNKNYIEIVYKIRKKRTLNSYLIGLYLIK